MRRDLNIEGARASQTYSDRISTMLCPPQLDQMEKEAAKHIQIED